MHGVNVLAYDYTGYGISPNKPSEKDTYRDVEYVLSYAVMGMKFKLQNIVLWGYSIGTCPSVDLAHKYSNLGGLILGSPLASILTWIDKSGSWKKLKREELRSNEKSNDLFDNFSKIDKVECRILIVHGTNDSLISIDHSHLLLEKYVTNKKDNQRCMFLPIEEATHSDLQGKLIDYDSPYAQFTIEYLELMFREKKVLTTKFDEELRNLRMAFERITLKPRLDYATILEYDARLSASNMLNPSFGELEYLINPQNQVIECRCGLQNTR
eukprot:TRINITY_DN9498_c0_g1_i10.p1 TRINITY_DN9498_c0_g1~~TRINITY_DN9498_c0_g1_i10.p1  ORF type:complete len:269 (+),score=17.29 TRINITY_DN9498_c0_g1_i10:417-1223(+)